MPAGPTASGLDYLANLMTTGETAVPWYYLALIPEIEPGFSSTGETITEPAFDEYARVGILNQSSAWNVSNGVLTNSYEVDFPMAIGEWGSIAYWAVLDDPVGGRAFWVGQFGTPFYVGAGGIVTCSPGTFSLWFEGNQWKMGQ